ncbi:MAG TPA: hypothetical protein VIQ30_07730 [Pseudonocardia sp.]
MGTHSLSGRRVAGPGGRGYGGWEYGGWEYRCWEYRCWEYGCDGCRRERRARWRTRPAGPGAAGAAPG